MTADTLALTPELEARWQVLRGLGAEIPSQPRLLQDMEALVVKPDFRVRQLAALVKRDPGLTAHLFETINSPMFCFVREVETVDDALTILGLAPALDLFRGILLRQALGEGPALDRFWVRSRLIAELAAAIVQRQNLPVSVNMAYLAGLFHAAGAALIMRAQPEYAEALAEDAGWRELDGLDRRFGYDYAFAGYMLCRQWHLPGAVAEAVLHQAAPPRAHPQASLTAVLHLAVYLYNRVFTGADAESWPEAQADVLAVLGLDADELSDLA